MATSKSHSWWRSSYISPRNSKWLNENLQETDRLVNETLKLIEEDGDSFAKKAQMYYQRRPELIARVGDFHRMYRALAERYEHVICDLAKNIPTELQSQGSVNGSESGTEATSLSLPSSPDRTSEHNKLNHLKPHWKSSSFEVLLLGTGERSDNSKKCFDESSSESSFDCDNGNVIDDFENTSKLEDRIFELEQELCKAWDKLRKCKNEHNEQCDDLVNKEYVYSSSTTSSLENQPVVAKNFMELVKQIKVFEADLPDRREEIENLKEAMEAAANQFEIEISCRDDTIKEYRTWLDAVLKKFVLLNSSPNAELKSVNSEEKAWDEQTPEHKSSLEIKTMEQEETIKELKAMATLSSNLLQHEKSLLEAKLSSLVASTSSYESKLQFFEERVKRLEAEKGKVCTENEKQIDELKQNLYKSKMKVDMLTLEKDELNTEVIRLIEDIETWDDESRKIDEQLRELQFEHEKLIQEVEDARKASVALTNRVRELEEEVEMQRGVIIDCAEGKREAIRHLCFSLEHYRDGYQQLRQILQMKIKGWQS